MEARNIWDQHRAAFSNVSAWAIMRGAERVATIAIKYPRDGAGRLYAYVHWIGEPMVRGFANGYGYDKRSAACADAARKLNLPQGQWPDGTPHYTPAQIEAFEAFKAALMKDSGVEWVDRLRDAGFTTLQAV